MIRPASWPTLRDRLSEATPSPGRRVSRADTGWWLEDAVPGGVIRHPHGRTLDEAEHVWLAWVTHNVSDVHGDAHTTTAGPFGGPLVLGALTVAIVIGLAEPAAPDPALAGSTMTPGWGAIRLSGPVRPGDTLWAESRISSVRPGASARVGLVTRTINGLDQAGRVVVVVEEIDRPVARRPTAT
jgi:acyl dehydratase